MTSLVDVTDGQIELFELGVRHWMVENEAGSWTQLPRGAVRRGLSYMSRLTAEQAKDAEIERLREALRRYGECEPDCDNEFGGCSCGFKSALNKSAQITSSENPHHD